MKIRNLMLALGALLLLSSCWEDENDNPVFPEGDEVVFKSSIAGQVTRAEGDVWHPNDEIGIYMGDLEPGPLNILEYNKHYVTSGNGIFTPVSSNDRLFYPANGQKVDFVAFYPYVVIDDYLEYVVDVRQQTNQAAIDLLFSKNVVNKDKNEKIIELNFLHQLSKVVFKILPGEGLVEEDLEDLEVSIEGFNTKTKFNVISGNLVKEQTEPEVIITNTAAPGKLYEAIIIPTTVTAAHVVFNLKNSAGDRFTWNIPVDTKFESGKKHTYAVTIKRTDIIVTGTIEDWVDGTGGEIIAD